jgi:DNA-binding transcriptional MerR regulator
LDEGNDKSPEAFRTITEVADSLDLPQHVLRFWETRFPQIKPLKRGGGRRYYRPDDVELLRAIKGLLYDRGFTIKGVQKLLREQGVHSAIRAEAGQAAAPSPAPRPAAPPAPATRTEPVFAAEPPAATRLSESDAAKLRSTLAELREAERQLRLVRSF